MRPLIHLISVLLVLPCVGLAAAFLVFGHAIAMQSWGGFFGVLLDTAAWLLPWGMLSIVASLLLLVWAGLVARFRLAASLCVTVLAIASVAIVLGTSAMHSPLSLDQLVVFAPSLVSAFLSLWLAVRERSGTTQVAA